MIMLALRSFSEYTPEVERGVRLIPKRQEVAGFPWDFERFPANFLNLGSWPCTLARIWAEVSSRWLRPFQEQAGFDEMPPQGQVSGGEL